MRGRIRRRVFRSENNRFNEPDPNKKAIVAIVLALFAFVEMIVSIIHAYGQNIDVGKLHAVLGTTALIASAFGFGLSISCIRHGGIFKTLPRIAIIITAIVFVLWNIIYISGLVAL